MAGDERGTPSLPSTPPLTDLRPSTPGDETERGGGALNWWGDMSLTWGAEGGGGTHGNWTTENGTWSLDEEWAAEANWTAPHGNWSVLGVNESTVGGGGAALDPHLLVTATTALVLGVMILATIVGEY